MRSKVLLDMDGVLTDLVGQIQKEFGIVEIPKGNYNIHEWYNTTPNKFWGVVSNDERFWLHLSKTPEADELINMLEPFDVCILTAPTLNPHVAKWKMEWINKHIPKFKRKFLIGPAKEFCAGPDKILIDDSESNCQKFEEKGGESILFPRPWNKHYYMANQPLMWVKKRLTEMSQ